MTLRPQYMNKFTSLIPKVSQTLFIETYFDRYVHTLATHEDENVINFVK